MIKNYFVIAWRNLTKNRLFSFITIFGLSLSMSVGMMVVIRTVDSLSYDTFHPYTKRIFRITSEITNAEKTTWELASTPLPLQGTLATEPVVECAVSLYNGVQQTATDGVKDIH